MQHQNVTATTLILFRICLINCCEEHACHLHLVILSFHKQQLEKSLRQLPEAVVRDEIRVPVLTFWSVVWLHALELWANILHPIQEKKKKKKSGLAGSSEKVMHVCRKR